MPTSAYYIALSEMNQKDWSLNDHLWEKAGPATKTTFNPAAATQKNPTPAVLLDDVYSDFPADSNLFTAEDYRPFAGL